MFPTIFSLALRDAGTKTKLASSLLIMTIVGGAVAPVIMGYIADTTGSMAIAFLIPLVCYGVIGGYAAMPRNSSTDVGEPERLSNSENGSRLYFIKSFFMGIRA